MKKVLTLLSLSLISAFSLAQSAYIPPEKPRLVIGIIVEQLRFDQLERIWDILPADGLKRLVSEGTYYRNVSLDYLSTQAGPGYATISTGATPADHGITSDSWFHPFNDQMIYCVQDPDAGAVGGTFETGLFSPANLLSSTFADELEMSSCGQSRVYGIGMKEMGAILTAGHAADGAFWYDDRTGTWMSSNYYGPALPGWLMDLNAMLLPGQYLNQPWTTMMDPALYPGCQPDSSDLERGFNGQSWFPYDLKELSTTGRLLKTARDYSILRETPFADDFTTELALRLISNEQMGQDDVTDYLAVAYSATEQIGHRYGPSSVESSDALVRLDRNVSRLLGEIDKSLGKKNVLVYFVSAHGISEIPAVLAASRIPSGYFRVNQSLQLLRSYLNAIYGKGEWIRGFFDNQIYLNRPLVEDAKISLGEMQRRVARFMVQFSGIAAAVPTSSFEMSDFSSGLLFRMSNNFSQQRSGDVMIALNPGWVEKTDHVTGHNSPYEYDSHVPLIWFGWTASKASVTRSVSTRDIAVTLSILCRVPLPNAASGDPLHELFR
ncbi:MAG: alkaline phosphatase family protein [Bacteroidales bacterium]|nr:alkaline phosphatase family protein [Bacteroidales bacterium]MDT8374047.1 alkaline phosphatase family protein [Bacteroidales bacterium]